MDRKLPEKAEIERLIRLSERARTCLESEAARIKERFDIPARIRSSLKEHPASWVFGSMASGLVASLLFSRHQKPAVKTGRRGAAGVLLGITLTAAKPLAKVWLANQVKDWMTRPPSSSRPQPRSHSLF